MQVGEQPATTTLPVDQGELPQASAMDCRSPQRRTSTEVLTLAAVPGGS